MSDREVTRRQVLHATAALFGTAALGCGVRGPEKTEGIKDASEATPMSRDPAPKLGWEVIASGNAGPGVRSRHGLVYDRSTKAAVLFGGVVWDPDWNLQADTWELHGREWTQVKTSETPPARHRGAMAY